MPRLKQQQQRDAAKAALSPEALGLFDQNKLRTQKIFSIGKDVA